MELTEMISYIILYIMIVEVLYAFVNKRLIFQDLARDFSECDREREYDWQGYGVIDFFIDAVKYLLTPIKLTIDIISKITTKDTK